MTTLPKIKIKLYNKYYQLDILPSARHQLFTMRIPSNRTLGKICMYTGIAGISAVMLMRHKIISDIKNAEYYRNAMKILRSHLGAVKYLGEPIKDAGFDLTDSHNNYCCENKAQFEVSVKGPKDKGKMFFWAERAESKEWIVNRLELELKSFPDKRLIIRKQS